LFEVAWVHLVTTEHASRRNQWCRGPKWEGECRHRGQEVEEEEEGSPEASSSWGTAASMDDVSIEEMMAASADLLQEPASVTIFPTTTKAVWERR
jgi:hypothetical protein